jgi:cytosine/adenosine deaminase-related metal-dependent hydrolase
MSEATDFGQGRPLVLRGGTVLPVDDAHSVLAGTDVLVVDDRIAAVGVDVQVPQGTVELDARDGIVMPGMIDTHRHMWQTAMRGYGADWTLTQYFVWYYLESGKHFRPQDVRAGNLLAAAEAVDAGITTCVDWSHGLQTTEHAEAALDALRSMPGRYVLAATLSADSYHRIAATGGSVSVSTESEQSAGQGYPPTWALRAHGIPISLSMDTSVWWSGDLFSAMRATLGADRAREHFEAHAGGDTITHCALRAEQVVDWATRGGARALGRDSWVGSIDVGKKADLVLLKNEHSPVSFPILNPHGHVAFQAQRGDVHTVVVDGRVVKHNHRLLEVDLAAIRREIDATVDHLRTTLGDEAWHGGMNPDVPETKILDNPYTYTDYRTSATHSR